MAKTRRTRARRKPASPKQYGGDHGTGTLAAAAGTIVEPIQNEDGKNPNNIARRRRLSAIDAMTLTMRQEQAARKIETAWCKLEMVTSGSELKETVDSSGRPDAVVASQIEAQSEWCYASSAIIPSERAMVEMVCCDNLPIMFVGRHLNINRPSARFKNAMDRAADFFRY